jgi:hypothetical protein
MDLPQAEAAAHARACHMQKQHAECNIAVLMLTETIINVNSVCKTDKTELLTCF